MTETIAKTEYILKVRNLTHVFDNKTALNDVSFDVVDGEFLAILGPSGCGKTTILRILIGLLDATSGSITMNDVDITRAPSGARNMGIVFQNYALFENMTVWVLRYCTVSDHLAVWRILHHCLFSEISR